jgi:multiple antibiotic resistance protein
MDFWPTAFSLFILMDAAGNVPLYISILRGMNPHRQRVIILRELFIALGIIILFALAGNRLMQFLDVTCATLQIAGGLILFLLSLKMIFPAPHPDLPPHPDEDPFLVPLAIPLIAGPGVLATVMILSHQEGEILTLIGAITVAWLASLIILLASPFLKRVLGEKGLMALERLMGLVLILLAVEMFLGGTASFLGLEKEKTHYPTQRPFQ